nr:heme ABC transporter ATP-binding protein [Shewanella sp. NIFS-20-20]
MNFTRCASHSAKEYVVAQHQCLTITELSVQQGRKVILRDINARFSYGSFTALLGPNGAGKSSLLKCISQDTRVHTGKISLYDRELTNWSRLELARQMAVLPQYASLSFPFTVQQVIAMGLYPLSLDMKAGEECVTAMLEQLQLTHLAQQSYPALSGGEKQRVHIARVLVQLTQAPRPAVLLLDEPTSALDLAQQHRVLGLLQTLAKERQFCVISVLHDINQAARYADQIMVLNQGNMVISGTPNECLTADLIESVWNYRPQAMYCHLDLFRPPNSSASAPAAMFF